MKTMTGQQKLGKSRKLGSHFQAKKSVPGVAKIKVNRYGLTLAMTAEM